MVYTAGRKSTVDVIKRGVKEFARNVLGVEISRARPHTQFVESAKNTRRMMHFARLLEGVKDLEGVIVECGVGSGRSLFVSAAISEAINRKRRILAYDTFEGIPPATMVDGKWNAHLAGNWNFSRDQVRANLLGTGLALEYIDKYVTFVQGKLRDTLPSYNADSIAFLHLDVDLYESYWISLKYLYNHVAPGGVIAFDEYREERWPGATEAIDRFFRDRPEQVVRSPVAERYFVIKCG